ncbi:kinase-like domain-containing protein [Rhizophagus irregularis DAOM 181602=DAOM 197198]|nr:kinase-like domain-containing protein [Rhizophagus irregularis DAOM 181602=DAOM 197198]
MKDIKISDNIFEQIKDFDHFNLTEEQNFKILEWIEYDRFENIEYLTKGGFGTSYKAIWKDGYIEYWNSENNQWKRGKKSDETYPVVLKCLHNSQDITVEFLNEIETHIIATNSHYVTRCHGFTKDPESNNFMIVMEYVENGSLRQYLNNSFNSMKWDEKMDILRHIASGLDDIHKKGLIHHDLHCGNILKGRNFTYITDLGLYQPANVKYSQGDHKKVYGVLPYVAPEVLRGDEYTQESDIYAFGIIADLEINKQIEKVNEFNEKLIRSSSSYNGITLSYIINSQAIYTSRLLDFKNLPAPRNVDTDDDDNSESILNSIILTTLVITFIVYYMSKSN